MLRTLVPRNAVEEAKPVPGDFKLPAAQAEPRFDR